jgi:poly-gamma-glutamate system protein
MIPWVKPTIPRTFVILACLLALVGVVLAQATIRRERHPYFEKQVRGAQLMEECLEVLREARTARGLTIDRELDPNLTGLIGQEFTAITTTIGNLEAKRTSTNPSFAALMVRLFYEADLRPGAKVAIGASGSFPGLILATLAACHAMELEPLLFYSVGASMYGANIPEFTFVEMLHTLREKGLLGYEILAVSLGSDNDRGDGMFFPESRDIMLEIAKSSQAHLIVPENNAQSIQERLALYREYNDSDLPDIFVNIGGASPNMGNTNASLQFPSGLVTKTPVSTDDPERGLIFEYIALGVPVIHLLNIRDLAIKSGMAIDPIPFPSVGTEDVYFITKYPKWLIWGSVVGALGILVWGRKKIQKRVR